MVLRLLRSLGLSAFGLLVPSLVGILGAQETIEMRWTPDELVGGVALPPTPLSEQSFIARPDALTGGLSPDRVDAEIATTTNTPVATGLATSLTGYVDTLWRALPFLDYQLLETVLSPVLTKSLNLASPEEFWSPRWGDVSEFLEP